MHSNNFHWTHAADEPHGLQFHFALQSGLTWCSRCIEQVRPRAACANQTFVPEARAWDHISQKKVVDVEHHDLNL